MKIEKLYNTETNERQKIIFCSNFCFVIEGKIKKVGKKKHGENVYVHRNGRAFLKKEGDDFFREASYGIANSNAMKHNQGIKVYQFGRNYTLEELNLL